jgi:hypothetical protein
MVQVQESIITHQNEQEEFQLVLSLMINHLLTVQDLVLIQVIIIRSKIELLV